MNAIKNFFRAFYDAAWLREQRDAKVSHGLGFFTLVAMIASLIMFAPISFIAAPKAVDEAMTAIKKEVPEFKAKIENEQAIVTDLAQPYRHDFSVDEDGATFTVFVDTVSTTTPDILDLVQDHEKSGAIMLTRDMFAVYDPQNGVKSQTFEGVTSTPEVTKTDVVTILDKINAWFMPWIALAMQTLLMIFAWLGDFFFVLYAAAVFLILARALGFNWTYGQTFRVSLYAFALPTIAATVLASAGLHIPFLKTIIFLIFAYLILKSGAVAAEPKAETV